MGIIVMSSSLWPFEQKKGRTFISMVVHSTSKSLTSFSYVLDPTFFAANQINYILCSACHNSLMWLDYVFFACCVATKTIAFYYMFTSFTFFTTATANYSISVLGSLSYVLPMGVDFEDTISLSQDEVALLVYIPFFKGLGQESVTLVCRAICMPPRSPS